MRERVVAFVKAGGAKAKAARRFSVSEGSAKELHFGRAAERLYLTQPALTRQIQALETALQVQLFKRDRRHVELTAAGRSFLTSVDQLLEDLERGIQLTRKIASQESRQIRLGATIPALYNLVPKILGRC